MRFDTDPEIYRELQQGYRWAVILGILMMILGILAATFPLFATLVVTVLLGWLLLFAGIFKLVYTFQTRKAGNFFWKLLAGVVYLVAGIVVLQNPIGGVLTLTLVLGIAIFIQGVLKTILAFQLRPDSNWGLVLFSGIVSIILGIFIWSEWPLNAPWVIGLLVGISLFFDGLWIVMLSAAARSLPRER